jgi:hypothetical protein
MLLFAYNEFSSKTPSGTAHPAADWLQKETIRPDYAQGE